MKAGAELPLKARITFGKFQNVDMRVALVTSAPMADGTHKPARILTLDVGHLGTFQSVGQYALVDEDDLVGRKVVICCNLGERQMGSYVSEALVLGVPHPNSPEDQEQAIPLGADPRAILGDPIF